MGQDVAVDVDARGHLGKRKAGVSQTEHAALGDVQDFLALL
jgi:hypothetical protein